MYPQEEEEEDDLFEGEDELPALQQLLDKIGYAGDASALISDEEEIAVCAGFVDDSDRHWRENLREQILEEPDKADLEVLPENSEDKAARHQDAVTSGESRKTAPGLRTFQWPRPAIAGFEQS